MTVHRYREVPQKAQETTGAFFKCCNCSPWETRTEATSAVRLRRIEEKNHEDVEALVTLVDEIIDSMELAPHNGFTTAISHLRDVLGEKRTKLSPAKARR